MEQVFVPTQDIYNLETSVYATINGLPFPFIGVNGRSACDEIYNVDNTPAGCHLKAWNKYIYRNSFPIYFIYPEVYFYFLSFVFQYYYSNINCFLFFLFIISDIIDCLLGFKGKQKCCNLL